MSLLRLLFASMMGRGEIESTPEDLQPLLCIHRPSSAAWKSMQLVRPQAKSCF